MAAAALARRWESYSYRATASQQRAEIDAAQELVEKGDIVNGLTDDVAARQAANLKRPGRRFHELQLLV